MQPAENAPVAAGGPSTDTTSADKMRGRSACLLSRDDSQCKGDLPCREDVGQQDADRGAEGKGPPRRHATGQHRDHEARHVEQRLRAVDNDI